MRLHNSKNIPNWIVASAMSEVDLRLREVIQKYKGSPKEEVIEEMRKSEPQATPEDLNRIYDEENGAEVKPVEPPKEVKDKMEGGSAAIEGDASLKQANSPNIDKVVEAIKAKGTEAEFVSPNFVNDIANEVGAKLTSDEVVYISDNIENLLMGKEAALKVADQTVTITKQVEWLDKAKKKHTKTKVITKTVPDDAKVKEESEPIPEGAKETVEEEVIEAKKEEVSPKPIESESVSPKPAVGVEAKSEVGDILVVLNSTSNGGSYPIGNKELTEKVKKLEEEGKLHYDSLADKWKPGKGKVEASGSKKVAGISANFTGGSVKQLPTKHLQITVSDKSILEGINDLPELFESARLIGNGWSFIAPEDIGALTAAPIVGYDVDMDDQGTITSAPNVWWYPQYETKDPIEELKSKGSIILQWADDAGSGEGAKDPEEPIKVNPEVTKPK